MRADKINSVLANNVPVSERMYRKIILVFLIQDFYVYIHNLE